MLFSFPWPHYVLHWVRFFTSLISILVVTLVNHRLNEVSHYVLSKVNINRRASGLSHLSPTSLSLSHSLSCYCPSLSWSSGIPVKAPLFFKATPMRFAISIAVVQLYNFFFYPGPWNLIQLITFMLLFGTMWKVVPDQTQILPWGWCKIQHFAAEHKNNGSPGMGRIMGSSNLVETMS